MKNQIRRREFVTILGGAAAAWPLAARAQQDGRMRRVGALMGGDENDPEVKLRYSAFMQALAGLGWTDGRNLRMELRWRGRGDDINRIRASARELVGLQPEVILVSSTEPTAALQRETRTISIVFVNVSDPVPRTAARSSPSSAARRLRGRWRRGHSSRRFLWSDISMLVHRSRPRIWWRHSAKG
jgi:hypothetical protein